MAGGRIKYNMFDLEYRLFMEDFMKPVARVLSPYISPNQTTIIGFVFGLLSCLFNYYSIEYLSFICFLLNRVLDCVDGIIARISNRQSDFGGYLDIIVDFIIYALLPLTSVLSSPSYNSFVLLAVLLSSYYVNSASLFMLSAILEKRNLGSKAKGEKTTVNMPPAVILI